jgi:hypothetical protein
MTEDKHQCDEREEGNINVIFYSGLFHKWAMKIYPANYYLAKASGVLLDTVMITISYCPYCGDEL